MAAFGLATAKTLTSMATGNLGIGAQAKKMLEFRDSISALAVAADLSEQGVEGLRQQIHATAKATNQMQESVVDALGAFVAKTGDLETGRKNLELYGKVATATGASLKDVANVGVELKQKLGITEQAEAMAVLVKQAKLGAIEFKDMASVGPRILAAAGSSGAHGVAGIRGAGAAIQVIASGFGGRSQGASATTAYENMISVLQKAKTREKIGALGIAVDGRDANEIFMDIIRKTGGDPTKMREIFRTQQAFRGATAFARQFKETGGFADFEKFRDVGGGAGSLDVDFARRASTGHARLEASQIAIAATLDNKVGPAFEGLAKHADKIAGVFQWGADNLKTSIALFAGGMVGWKMLMARLSGGGGGGVGGLLGGVQHVWVDNWGGGPGGGASPSGGKAAAIAKLAAAATVGYAIGSAADELSGGRLSGGGASAIGAMSGQRERLGEIYDIGVSSHAYKLQSAAAARRMRIAGFEAQGMSHGQAVFQADAAVQNLTVYVDGDKASAEIDGATRAPEVMVKRGYATNGGRRGR